MQPSPTGGVDTVTDAHRIPERDSWDSVHVTMRIGTLLATVDDPTMRTSNPRHLNAFLNHYWGNFGWNFALRLGNIGLSVLEPFETIVDYTHRRVILIRLDSAGHRLPHVPTYTPTWSTPLLDIPMQTTVGRAQFWGIAAAQPDYTLDTLNTRNNTATFIVDTGAPSNVSGFLGGGFLGYPFLSHFGVIGFNHRTHQFILYH